MTYFDLGMKLELVLWDLNGLIYWVSLIELNTFVLSMIFFLRLTNMSAVFLFLPHAFRGIAGMVINRRMPRSHHIIRDVSVPYDEENSHL